MTCLMRVLIQTVAKSSRLAIRIARPWSLVHTEDARAVFDAVAQRIDDLRDLLARRRAQGPVGVLAFNRHDLVGVFFDGRVEFQQRLLPLQGVVSLPTTSMTGV